jgi:hypothetical protein
VTVRLTSAAVARLGVAGLLATAATACTLDDGVTGGCEATDIPDHAEQTLVVEGDPWSGYALFRRDGFVDAPYDSIYATQLCQDVRAADLSSGRADFEVTSLDQYLLNKPDGTIVGVIDQSVGADALVLNTVRYPYLTSVDNLRQLVQALDSAHQKPVLAYTGNSPSEMLLNELANTSDELRLSDFELVSVDQSSTALQMLDDGDAALAVLWEPDTSVARSSGYTVALSSKDVPDSIVDVLVASNDLIEQDPAAVQAVVDAFYRDMDGYLAKPDSLERFIAEDGNLEPSAAKQLLAGITFYGTDAAHAFMNEAVFPLDQPRIEQSLRSLAAVLALQHPEVSADAARIDGGYVREAAT